MYEWKLFGIVVSSASILVTLVILIFVLAYSKTRHEKYKRALRIELDNTDENGNTVRLASLSRIYRQFFSNEPSAAAAAAVAASQNNQLSKALMPPNKLQQPLSQPPPLQLQNRSDSKVILVDGNKRILSSSTATNRQVRQSMSSDDTDMVRIDESTSSGVVSSSGGKMGISPVTMTTSRSNYVSLKHKQSSRSNRITPVDNYY